MKNWILLSLALVALPATLTAQDDDMYFASSKSKTTSEKGTSSSYNSGRTYYSGSSRSVDEYNRRGGSHYEVLPADTGDIISFAPVEGVYPDSTGSFSMTRRMQRWDDYVPSAAYWAGYDDGRHDAWGWHSPWYYTSYYYPWYDSWYYDPWYYDYYWHRPWYGYSWSWHSPYYYGYRGWYGGYYYRPYYRLGYASYRHTGTIDRYGRTHGSFAGNRSGQGRAVSVRSGNASRSAYGTSRSTTVRTTSQSGNFSGNRSTSSYGNTYGGSRTPTTSQSGNFGGSRSGGSFGGGGGSFGGSRGGGGSFGGSGGRSGGSRR